MAEIPDETLWQIWSIRLMAGLTVFWFFCLGACLGSFLNVLVWRWPLGRSVTREPSACPVCGTRIVWHDNIPILGWWRLRGRCRACGVAIPVRYPLVEALVGVQFVVLLCAEALTGGATLPVRPIDSYAGVVWILWYVMQPELLRIYVWHLALLYLCNLIWLIDEDRQSVPWTLGPWVLLIGLSCAAGFPDLYPQWNLHIYPGHSWTLTQRWQGLLTGGMGWLVGSLLGFFTSASLRTFHVWRRYDPKVLFMGGVGLVLGWQAVVSTALIAAGFGLIGLRFRPMLRSLGTHSDLFPLWLAVPVQLLAWRWLDAFPWWPGSRASWPVTVSAGVMAILIERFLSSSTALRNDSPTTVASDAHHPLPEPAFKSPKNWKPKRRLS